MKFALLFLFVSSCALSGNALATNGNGQSSKGQSSNGQFKTSDNNKIQQIIIGYLEQNSKSLMQRGGIEDIEVVPCGFSGTAKTIRVCSQYPKSQQQGGILTYGIQEETYAYLLLRILPAIKRVLVIEAQGGQLTRVLNGLGVITTSVTSGSMRELVKAIDLPGRLDAVVIGVNHGLTKDDLKVYLNFLAMQRLIVFTADPTDIPLGATIAIAPSQQEILASFVKILQFYKVTGLLKSTPPICVGSVRLNKRAARALNLDVSSKQLTRFSDELSGACL